MSRKPAVTPTLSGEVVAAIEREASLEARSRSWLVNQILIEGLAVRAALAARDATPAERMAE